MATTYTARGLPVQTVPAWLKPTDIAPNTQPHTRASSMSGWALGQDR